MNHNLDQALWQNPDYPPGFDPRRLSDGEERDEEQEDEDDRPSSSFERRVSK